MYTHMYIYKYIYITISIDVYISIYVYIHVYIHTCIWMNIHKPTHAFICIHAHLIYMHIDTGSFRTAHGVDAPIQPRSLGQNSQQWPHCHGPWGFLQNFCFFFLFFPPVNLSVSCAKPQQWPYYYVREVFFVGFL